MSTHTQTSLQPELVCAEADVPKNGTILTRTLNGRPIAIARRADGDDVIVAFDTQCPHMKGPLHFGRVVNGEVICPWHFFRYDTLTGEAAGCENSSMKLKTYSVQVQDGSVFVLMGT